MKDELILRVLLDPVVNRSDLIRQYSSISINES